MNRLVRVRAAARDLELRVVPPIQGRVAVSYGHDHLPAPGAPVSGGFGKFQRLQTWYPNHPRRFNILYLGSSTLPSDAEGLVARARDRHAPIVLNQNGVAYPAWAGERAETINARLRFVLRSADRVLYQSAFCKSTADRFLGEPTTTWEILHNAVDTNEFAPTTTRRADGPVVLLGGDQLQPYRLSLALEAFAQIVDTYPDALLRVTGKLTDGVARIRELRLEDRVELVGRYTQREAPDIYLAPPTSSSTRRSTTPARTLCSKRLRADCLWCSLRAAAPPSSSVMQESVWPIRSTGRSMCHLRLRRSRARSLTCSNVVKRSPSAPANAR